MNEAELKERLAKAKAQASQIESERDAEHEAGALEAQVADAERDAEFAVALQAAEREHGATKIAAVKTNFSGTIIVKAPHSAAFRRFQDLEAMKMEEIEKLVGPCVIYPAKVAYSKIVDEYPGILPTLATAVAGLAGVRVDVIAKKA